MRRLKENTRGDDTVSRLGGDEFLYLLMEVRDEASIRQIADKLIDAIESPLPINLRDLRLSLCLRPSIGIAIYPKDGATADALITSADLAMYEAKRDSAGFAFAAASRTA